MSAKSSTPTDLDERIAAAFVDGAESDDVASLIGEAEAAAAAADEEAEQARERALDPALSAADVAAARREMDDAAFRRDRLQVAVSRLGERLREVRAQEEDDRRRARYEEVNAERDRLAAELVDTYPAIERQLVDLLTRLDANDREVRHLNTNLPIGAGRVLAAELVARRLDGYVVSGTEIKRLAELRLPSFQWSAHRPLAWPRNERCNVLVACS